MAKVCIVEKYTDCDGVLFVEGLMKYDRVIEDLSGFSVFRAVDYYMFYCYSYISSIAYYCFWFLPGEIYMC